jgi:FtsP/CotA-like multicopper oxidase with cupredoxin domain
MAAWSRRHVVAGAGLAVACAALPDRAHAAVAGADGFTVLRARTGSAALRGEGQPPTPIWGYDGVVPGPTLRVKRGDDVRVRLVNELPEPTVVHWHGLRLPNAMDGVPHLTQHPIAPGESFDYRFRAPDAGTFWYHTHLYSSEQLERGLYGVLIVEEPTPVAVDRDIVMVVDDWRLTGDGKLDEASFRSFHDAAHDGRIGAHLTVNSAPSLDLPVRRNERLRLRLVNAANARVLSLRFERHAAWVMAIDGQPAEPFLARNSRVTLGPGNRIDVFVDAALDADTNAPIVVEDRRGDVTLGRLVYDRADPARLRPLPAPAPLPANPLPERLDLKGALRVNAPTAA